MAWRNQTCLANFASTLCQTAAAAIPHERGDRLTDPSAALDDARSGREYQFKREVVRRFLARIPGFKRDVSRALRVQRTVGRCGEIDGCGSRIVATHVVALLFHQRVEFG